jgi:hypothetical protein
MISHRWLVVAAVVAICLSSSIVIVASHDESDATTTTSTTKTTTSSYGDGTRGRGGGIGRIIPKSRRGIQSEIVQAFAGDATFAAEFDNLELVFEVFATGTQNYDCKTRMLHEPIATLVGQTTTTTWGWKKILKGTHFFDFTETPTRAGWQLNGGSKWLGTRIAGVDNPDGATNNIAWLYLGEDEVSDFGIMEGITRVVRAETYGGVLPADAPTCQETYGKDIEVPYTSFYFFYRPRQW